MKNQGRTEILLEAIARELQLTAEADLWQCGKNEGGFYIALYSSKRYLKKRIISVYEESWRYLPDFIRNNIEKFDQELPVNKPKNLAILNQCPRFGFTRYHRSGLSIAMTSSDLSDKQWSFGKVLWVASSGGQGKADSSPTQRGPSVLAAQNGSGQQDKANLILRVKNLAIALHGSGATGYTDNVFAVKRIQGFDDLSVDSLSKWIADLERKVAEKKKAQPDSRFEESGEELFSTATSARAAESVITPANFIGPTMQDRIQGAWAWAMETGKFSSENECKQLWTDIAMGSTPLNQGNLDGKFSEFIEKVLSVNPSDLVAA